MHAYYNRSYIVRTLWSVNRENGPMRAKKNVHAIAESITRVIFPRLALSHFTSHVQTLLVISGSIQRAMVYRKNLIANEMKMPYDT